MTPAKSAVLAAAHERHMRITPDADGKRPLERIPRAMKVPHGGFRIVRAFGVHEGATAEEAWEEAAKSLDGFSLIAEEAHADGRRAFAREMVKELEREVKRLPNRGDSERTDGKLELCVELLEWVEGKT